MVLDETQSTDVGDSSPVAAEASTSETAPSVGQSGEQANERSGDVTAQPAELEGQQLQGGESATPPPDEDDPLQGIPTSDELERQVEQKVPYAQALLQLRKALEARNSELGELRERSAPVEPILEQYGDAEAVKSRLEAYESLFTPVINPQTQQPELDPATGFPKVSALPFIERVDTDNPGMAEQFLFDALNYQAEVGTGQKVPLYQLPAVQAELLKACGLDPARADDYRNIDALSAPQDTGVITPEELAEIPAELHEAYKSLSSAVRDDVKNATPAAREQYLRDRQEVLEAKQARESQAREAETQRQQQEVAARAHVAREQESFVSQQLQESHAALMDDLASQVTFSDDANTNALMHGVVGACVLALRDPDSSFATQKVLEALGVKADPGFHQALADADKYLRDAKAYELFGHQGFKQNALTAANNAKKQAMAKAAPIALKIAKALGAQAVSKANQQGKALTDATRTRPVPGGDGSGEEANGILPAGMLPTDPRAGIYIARQTGLLGG